MTPSPVSPGADLGFKPDAAGSDLGFTPDQKQTPDQPTQGSAAGRFFGNLWDKTAGGAVGTAKVLYDIAGHGLPGSPPFDPAGPAAQFLTNTVNAHIDQGKKAKDALNQGNYTEAAGHMLAAALPFVGPAAANVGEQIGGSQATVDKYGKVIQPQQAPDIAGGLGWATALLAPLAVGPAIGKIAGKLDTAADATAQGLTKSALKGGYTVNTPAADVASAASTMRENQIPLSPAGSAKIGDALTNLRQVITNKTSDAAAAGVKVDPNIPIRSVMDTFNKYRQQVNPNQDLADIDKVAKNFAANNPGPIPADQAQAMKVGSNALNADKYGKVSTAQVEAEKALTRGIKEELENQIPELGSLNASQAKLMNLDDILGKAVNKYTNSAGFAGDLQHTGIAASALRAVIANPEIGRANC